MLCRTTTMNKENHTTQFNVKPWVAYGTVFISSAAIMILEIVAGRIISRYLGASQYTWTSVIGVVLAGISGGNYLGGYLSDRFRPRPLLTLIFALASVTALSIPIMNHWAGQWLWLLERSWPVRIALHVFLAFIVPSTLLGMISPVIARLMLLQKEKVGLTIGKVYAWGTVGSILGTFLAGFYLIAAFGTGTVILIIACLLAALAVYYGVMNGFTVFTACLAVFLFFCDQSESVVSDQVMSALRYETPAEAAYTNFYETESAYSYVAVRAEAARPDYRIMILDRLWHSKVNISNPAQLLGEYTWIQQAFIELFYAENNPLHCLIIGGGGYAMPGYLLEKHTNLELHVAEIDPVVTEAAGKALALHDDTRMHIANVDGRNYVTDLMRDERMHDRFDVILGDSINNYSIPYHLTTLEFNEQLETLLSPDGAYLVHFLDSLQSGRLIGAMVNTLERTFPFIEVVSVSGDRHHQSTFMVIASHEPLDVQAALAWIRTRYSTFTGFQLSSDMLQQCRERVGDMVLTDQHAPVDTLLRPVVDRDKGDLFTAYLTRASRDLRESRVERARAWITKVLEQDEHHFNALILLSELHMTEGDYAQAVHAVSRALAVRSASVRALQLKLDALMRQGSMAESAATAERLLEVHRRNLIGLNVLGVLRAREGHSDAALEYFRKAQQVAPGDGTAALLSRHFLSEESLNRSGRHARYQTYQRPVIGMVEAATGEQLKTSSSLLF